MERTGINAVEERVAVADIMERGEFGRVEISVGAHAAVGKKIANVMTAEAKIHVASSGS